MAHVSPEEWERIRTEAEEAEIQHWYKMLKAQELTKEELLAITQDENENKDKIAAAYRLIEEMEAEERQ